MPGAGGGGLPGRGQLGEPSGLMVLVWYWCGTGGVLVGYWCDTGGVLVWYWWGTGVVMG